MHVTGLGGRGGGRGGDGLCSSHECLCREHQGPRKHQTTDNGGEKEVAARQQASKQPAGFVTTHVAALAGQHGPCILLLAWHIVILATDAAALIEQAPRSCWLQARIHCGLLLEGRAGYLGCGLLLNSLFFEEEQRELLGAGVRAGEVIQAGWCCISHQHCNSVTGMASLATD